MAKPQSDGGGFIQIPNELYRAMYSVDLNGSELRILHFIVAQTIGYNQKSRKLTISYISAGTQIPALTVKKGLKKLIEKGIVDAQADHPNSPKVLSINKKYKSWSSTKTDTIMVPKTTGRIGYHDGTKTDTIMVPNQTPNKIQKRQYRKDNTECVGTPTKNEAISYFSERGYSEAVAEDFFNYYDALGWKVKGSRILRWEVFADRWMKTEYKDPDDDPTLDSWGNPIKPDGRE